MPEWVRILTERLGVLGLEPEREAEILTELANHQEDLCEEGQRRGLSEEEAIARALDVDWQELRREIRSAELEEIPMKQRTRSVWLPGLMTGALAWGLYWALETAGVPPRLFWWGPHLMMFSLPWTLSLPVIGALGAESSRRQGGRAQERLLAGLFPSVSLTILFCLGAAVRAMIERESLPPATFAVGLLCWAILPGMALLIGILPFVRRQAPAPSRAA